MEQTKTPIKKIHLVTNVYGDGQKSCCIVLEYERALAPESVSAKDYEVKDRQIEAVYTNTEPVIPEKSVEGNYALLVLSTDYTTPNYGGEGGPRAGDGPGPGSKMQKPGCCYVDNR